MDMSTIIAMVIVLVLGAVAIRLMIWLQEREQRRPPGSASRQKNEP